MTPYNHRRLWAASLNVKQMDELIAKYPEQTTGTMVVFYRGIEKTHLISDVMEAVRFCREEIRKDELMKRKQEQ